ncbi:MAG: PilZ domain-containing protein [Planctomycetota bacterium]|nr:PilZ domain-containing protein [Planctomycetota bacterium]
MSLFKRSRRGPDEGPERSFEGPALPDAADLHVTLRTGGEPPFRVQLHRMSIQGAEVVLPFHLAPADGSVAELEVRHIKDRWTVTTAALARELRKASSDSVHLELRFTNLGGLYAQLDDALGRYFNRRAATRVTPELPAGARVKLAHGAHRARGTAHDLSLTGVGATVSLAEAFPFKGGEVAEITLDIPGCGPELVGPVIVKHVHRAGPSAVLGVEFDLLADSPLRTRRREYVRFLEEQRAALEQLQRRLGRSA